MNFCRKPEFMVLGNGGGRRYGSRGEKGVQHGCVGAGERGGRAEGEPQPLASVIPEITTKSKLSGIQPVTSNPSITPSA